MKCKEKIYFGNFRPHIKYVNCLEIDLRLKSNFNELNMNLKYFNCRLFHVSVVGSNKVCKNFQRVID